MNGVVLLFHSVEDRELRSLKNLGNVRPGLFEKTVAALKKEFDMVGLDEITGRASMRRTGKERLLAVTFDDGPRSYAANAVPVMDSLDIPSACFLITDCIGDRAIYWRYLYNYCISAGHGKKLADLVAREYGTTVKEEDTVSFTRRNFSRGKNNRIIEEILGCIVSEAEYREREHGLFLSAGDLDALKNNPRVTFGIHTRSHPVMWALSEEEIRDEISGSLGYYRDTICSAYPMFSVPFGRLYRDYDERTISICRELSLEVILSAYGGDNREGQPLYNIRRIPVSEQMLECGFSSFLSLLRDRCAAADYAGKEKRLRDAVERRRLGE